MLFAAQKKVMSTANVTGGILLFSVLLLSSLELSDTKVYEPCLNVTLVKPSIIII